MRIRCERYALLVDLRPTASYLATANYLSDIVNSECHVRVPNKIRERLKHEPKQEDVTESVVLDGNTIDMQTINPPLRHKPTLSF